MYVGVIAALVVAGVFLVPVSVDQLQQLPDGLEAVASRIPQEEDVRALLARFGLPESTLADFYRPELLREQLQAALGSGVQGALALATGTLTFMVSALLVTVLSIYMLLDARRLTWGLLRLVPATQRDNVILLMSQWSRSFGGFIRGQVIQAMLFGAAVVVVMVMFGLGFVVVSAVSSAALMLLPIVGPVLALIPPTLVALFDPSVPAGAFLLVLVVLQTILINALMPRVLGGQLGIHPLLVLFAILVGLRVGGLLGSFFAVPIVGVIAGMANMLLKNGQTSEAAAPVSSDETGP